MAGGYVAGGLVAKLLVARWLGVRVLVAETKGALGWWLRSYWDKLL